MTGPRIPRPAQHGGWWSRSNVAANDPAGTDAAQPPATPFVDSHTPTQLPHVCPECGAELALDCAVQCGANTGTADPELMTLLAGAARVGEHIQHQRERRRLWDGVLYGVLGTAFGGLCLVALGKWLAARWPL